MNERIEGMPSALPAERLPDHAGLEAHVEAETASQEVVSVPEAVRTDSILPVEVAQSAAAAEQSHTAVGTGGMAQQEEVASSEFTFTANPKNENDLEEYARLRWGAH